MFPSAKSFFLYTHVLTHISLFVKSRKVGKFLSFEIPLSLNTFSRYTLRNSRVKLIFTFTYLIITFIEMRDYLTSLFSSSSHLLVAHELSPSRICTYIHEMT